MSTSNKRKARVTIFLIVASFVFARLCFRLLPGVFEPWNAQTVDTLFQVRSALDSLRPAYDNTIVHVDINNTAIQELNNFYLNRSHYAQVVRNLAAMDTAAQVYDVIFAARSNENDDLALIEATAAAANVYYGLAFALLERSREPPQESCSEEVRQYLEQTGWQVEVVQKDSDAFFMGAHPLLTFPALASASRGLGFLSIKADRDGVFRRAPLLVKYNGAFYPSLPFRVVCDYLGVSPQHISVKPGSGVTLKGARRPGATPHEIVIPIDRHGNMVINFIGPWERMSHYNFADAFRASEDRGEMEIWKEELAGKIVLISDVSTGASDIGPVPTDVGFPLSALHASVIHTILTEDFLRELSRGEMFLVELILALLLLLLSFRYSSLLFSLGTVALALCYVAAAALFFFYAHLIFHMVRPLFLLLFATVSVTAYRYFNEEKEKEFLRKTFEAYFPPAVVKKIMANPEKISAAGRSIELTVMFSDIKDFTAHTATMSPERIQRSLNEYFEAMVEIAFSYQGTVDKYIGDGLMVFFGDPEPQTDHALRCVHAAIDMQKRVRAIGARWASEGGMPLQIRIGINTGEVVVGNMGSARRLSYTVLGSAVNLAQRLESSAPVGGILIAQRTHEFVCDHVPTRSLGQIRVKGIDQPTNVYQVLVD